MNFPQKENEIDIQEEDEINSNEQLPQTQQEPQVQETDLGKDAIALLKYIQVIYLLADKEYENLKKRVWTFSATLRQPQKDDGKCNKTPFFNRWDTGETSHLTGIDPRYASHQECQKICATLLALLLEAKELNIKCLDISIKELADSLLGRELKLESLTCLNTGHSITNVDIKKALRYTTSRLGTYEIPVSYVKELNQGGLHRHNNVAWMKPLHINFKLRISLGRDLRAIGIESKAINNALEKIQVKAYCTDKNTMSPHFSNRDFRWATWTNGIQYASRYQCSMIELELMAQLYEFKDAPQLKKSLLEGDLEQEIEQTRGTPISKKEPRCCFTTGKVLSFTEYVEGSIKTKGGKSKYHVGHVIPLTRNGKHTYDNIAWISDDGNRIQGNNTIEEIEAKLSDAVEYHLRRDMNTPNHSSIFQEKTITFWKLLNEIRENLGKQKYPW